MFAEAALTVTLTVDAGHVADVTIASTRPVTASRILRGRTVAEALTLLPALFALCGRAQSVAALRAVENALGMTPDPVAECGRDLMVAAEAVQETATAILTTWAEVAKVPPRAEAARDLRRALLPVGRRLDDATLTAALDAVDRLGEALDAPAQALLHYAEGAEGAEGAERAAFGAGDTPFLPVLTAADMAPLLATDHDGSYRAAPTWQGKPAETGALPRRAACGPVASRLADHGTGLAARLAARLVDLRATMDSMRDAAGRLWHHDPDARARAGVATVPAAATGTGAGLCDTARGTLAHWVDIVDGRVRDWRILAPTEWNFHPDGPLARGVRGAPATPALLEDTRLLALALDPCVPCTVMLAR